jgi:hypothetical protein
MIANNGPTEASKKIGYKFSDRLIANLMELEVILHPQLQLDLPLTN